MLFEGSHYRQSQDPPAWSFPAPSLGKETIVSPSGETAVSPHPATFDEEARWTIDNSGVHSCICCFERFDDGPRKKCRYECTCPSATCAECFPSVEKCPLCHVSDAVSMSSAVAMKLIDSSQAGERFFWNRPNLWNPPPPPNPFAADVTPFSPVPEVDLHDPDNLWEGDAMSSLARQTANLAYRRDIEVHGFSVAYVCFVLASPMLHGC